MGRWWSASKFEPHDGSAYSRSMSYHLEGAYADIGDKAGFLSVRCVKD